ncbi:hypothetical protein CGMCC3_g13925 [Colletotrichum fructicola]|nr:uncharacterized protein CGMCC3_g13925 [Colletotrichum fructicola]KAE9569866.1 hypothetical protein CGMCC3_g13925 [Colletotrichum fructicola]
MATRTILSIRSQESRAIRKADFTDVCAYINLTVGTVPYYANEAIDRHLLSFANHRIAVPLVTLGLLGSTSVKLAPIDM